MSNPLSDLAAIIAEEDAALESAATEAAAAFANERPALIEGRTASFIEIWLAAFRAGADWEQRREIEEPT